MTRIVIVGAGGFGREVYNWCQDCRELASVDEVAFIDDDDNALSAFPKLKTLHISRIADFIPQPHDMLIMAVADPANKRRIAREIETRGGRFTSMVHNSATVSSDARIGLGSVLCPQVVVCANVTLGEHVLMNVASSAGHDAQIGEFSSVMGHVDITGQVAIGPESWISSHASILPGRTLGSSARVGAGSIVVRDVEAGGSVFGIPARAIPLPSTGSSGPHSPSSTSDLVP